MALEEQEQIQILSNPNFKFQRFRLDGGLAAGRLNGAAVVAKRVAMDTVRIHTTTSDSGTLTIAVPPELRGREVDVFVTAAPTQSFTNPEEFPLRLRRAMGLNGWLPELPREAFDRDDIGGR